MHPPPCSVSFAASCSMFRNPLASIARICRSPLVALPRRIVCWRQLPVWCLVGAKRFPRSGGRRWQKQRRDQIQTASPERSAECGWCSGDRCRYPAASILECDSHTEGRRRCLVLFTYVLNTDNLLVRIRVFPGRLVNANFGADLRRAFILAAPSDF